MSARRPIRWHIAVFLAPAVLVYTAIMIVPLFGTLNLSLFNQTPERTSEFVGLDNFRTLFGDPRWSGDGIASPARYLRGAATPAWISAGPRKSH